MPQQVVDLLANWRGQFGSHHNIEVHRMVPLYLMWCIWRDCNAQNFEDCNRTVMELKAILFKTVYGWMVAFNGSHVSNFREFLDLCSSL
jgi:hypothetical protein